MTENCSEYDENCSEYENCHFVVVEFDHHGLAGQSKTC